jgi:hypothetical protein
MPQWVVIALALVFGLFNIAFRRRMGELVAESQARAFRRRRQQDDARTAERVVLFGGLVSVIIAVSAILERLWQSLGHE